jgi:hypothetical protein
VLGDVLSQVRDPAAVLAMVRRQIAPGGRVVLSIRNSQHWSVFARLALGDLHYRADTPVAPGDLHLFTRATILDLLRDAGFAFVGGSPVIKEEAGREAFLPAIRALAQAGGTDGELAVQDAQAWQFVIVAQAA